MRPGRKSARARRGVIAALLVGMLAGVPMAAQSSGTAPVPAPIKPAPPPGSAAGAAGSPPLFNSPLNIKARQVVERSIKALGGAAFMAERDREGHGRIYTFDSLGGLANAGTLFWDFRRFPDAERIELTKKRNVIYIYNGDKGWQITFRGVQPLPAEAMTRFKISRDHSMDVILRKWAQNPQTLMIYRGISMVDQGQVESVSFSNADGEDATMDFDLNTHLPVRVRWRQDDPTTGGYYEKSVTYGNFQMIDGINTPLIVQDYNGPQRIEQVYYEGIEYAPLPASKFEPPPSKKK